MAETEYERGRREAIADFKKDPDNHVDLKLENGKMIALHDSVTEQTYDYLVNKGRAEAISDFIKIIVEVLNEMPVEGDAGYRTIIGDKVREKLSKLNKEAKNE